MDAEETRQYNAFLEQNFAGLTEVSDWDDSIMRFRVHSLSDASSRVPTLADKLSQQISDIGSNCSDPAHPPPYTTLHWKHATDQLEASMACLSFANEEIDSQTGANPHADVLQDVAEGLLELNKYKPLMPVVGEVRGLMKAIERNDHFWSPIEVVKSVRETLDRLAIGAEDGVPSYGAVVLSKRLLLTLKEILVATRQARLAADTKLGKQIEAGLGMVDVIYPPGDQCKDGLASYKLDGIESKGSV